MNEAPESNEAASTQKRHRRARRIWLLVLSAVCLAAVLLIRYFWFSTPVGKGPAGPAVPRAPFQAVWTARPVLLLGIGDSITAGFGASEGHSYFSRLIFNPPDEFPEMKGICLSSVLPNLTCRNLAVSGSTSLQHHAH